MKKRIAVIFGSRSVEHEVSIITAVQAMNTLDDALFDVVPLYIAKDGVWYTGDALKRMDAFSNLPGIATVARRVLLQPFAGKATLTAETPRGGLFARGETLERLAIDAALLCTHGTNGEDGTLQGTLELLGIPYTGAGVTGSVLGMDKVVMKKLFAAAGLPIVPYISLSRGEWQASPDSCLRTVEASLEYPLFVKPANLGSSVGITRATDCATLKSALEVASHFDRKLLVEKAVTDLREINCAVLGNDAPVASACEEVFSSHAFLDYDAKYKVGYKASAPAKGTVRKGEGRKVPAELAEDLSARIREFACRAFAAVDCRGLARVDFLLDGQECVYVNEINTIPGSLSYYLWEATGMQYRDLLTRLLELAEESFQDRRRNIVSYDVSDLLKTASQGKATRHGD
jgi:D-alanine-D-alanine ligase